MSHRREGTSMLGMLVRHWQGLDLIGWVLRPARQQDRQKENSARMGGRELHPARESVDFRDSLSSCLVPCRSSCSGAVQIQLFQDRTAV